MKKLLTVLLIIFIVVVSACAEEVKLSGTKFKAPEPAQNLDTTSNKVIIYSGSEEYRNEYFIKRIKEEFPDYDITIQYMPTGNLAAKLAAEGTDTDIDIIYDLDFSYSGLVEKYLADLSKYDQSIYVDDCKVKSARYLVNLRNSGGIIINPAILAERGIKEPTSYEDLLKPEYKGLISMPSPKTAGTGYMFLKNLVNAWGEEKALKYFEKLSDNILQFTSSGLGPVKAVVQGEAAVGLGITSQAVTAINDGANLKIVFFKEGSPYTLCTYAIPEGKQKRKAVVDVFNFLYSTLIMEDRELYYPEQIYVNQVSSNIANYPKNIPYGDMSGNTTEEKSRLLDKWEY